MFYEKVSVVLQGALEAVGKFCFSVMMESYSMLWFVLEFGICPNLGVVNKKKKGGGRNADSLRTARSASVQQYKW